MSEYQKTIKQDVVISGTGLHTGASVNIRLKPANSDDGIRFIRTDLPGHPAIEANASSVVMDPNVSRCTSVGRNGAVIHTVEHFMSVLCGLGIDNLTIEIDNNELPGLDGSGIEFLKAIQKAGVVEQKSLKRYCDILEPVGVEHQGSSIYVFPAPEFKISYTLDYDNPYLRSQFISIVLNQSTFEREIAPCRTFCLEKETGELRVHGLGKGANYKNTLVVGEHGVIDNEVRFKDEFARHKVLDFIGDLYLLGMPMRGHVFAVKSGHRLNLALLKKIHQQKLKHEERPALTQSDWSGKKEYNINDIVKVLPHRYPFLFIDRIIELEPGKKAVGIKNVTINDNFFTGHFPSRPVMPGVVMVEALAQTAGFVVLTNEKHRGKLALFMSADKVKFRKVVSPGDQLHLHVEIVSDKSTSSKIQAQAKVGDQVAVEAELVFSYTDSSFLG